MNFREYLEEADVKMKNLKVFLAGRKSMARKMDQFSMWKVINKDGDVIISTKAKDTKSIDKEILDLADDLINQGANSVEIEADDGKTKTIEA